MELNEVPDWMPPYDGEPAGPTGPVSPRATESEPAGPDTGDSSDRAVPGPDGWPSRFAQVLAETLAGARPARQLTPWTTEQTRKRIQDLGPLMASAQRPRLRRVMTSAPAPAVLEVTAVVGFGTRVRVLALRLEQADDATDRWRCTALESA